MKTTNMLFYSLSIFISFQQTFFYLLFSFSIGVGVVDDPCIISNAHQVTFTEPIAVIVVQILYKKNQII